MSKKLGPTAILANSLTQWYEHNEVKAFLTYVISSVTNGNHQQKVS